MCLYAKQVSKIADNDIVCYKVIEIWFDGYMCTPYQYKTINFGIRYYECGTFKHYNVLVTQNIVSNDTITNNNVIITGDSIHLFKDLEDAIKFAKYKNNSNHSSNFSYQVIKAIIPKGTEYIEGEFQTFFDTYKSIATKSVIYQPLD